MRSFTAECSPSGSSTGLGTRIGALAATTSDSLAPAEEDDRRRRRAEEQDRWWWVTWRWWPSCDCVCACSSRSRCSRSVRHIAIMSPSSASSLLSSSRTAPTRRESEFIEDFARLTRSSDLVVTCFASWSRLGYAASSNAVVSSSSRRHTWNSAASTTRSSKGSARTLRSAGVCRRPRMSVTVASGDFSSFSSSRFSLAATFTELLSLSPLEFVVSAGAALASILRRDWKNAAACGSGPPSS